MILMAWNTVEHKQPLREDVVDLKQRQIGCGRNLPPWFHSLIALTSPLSARSFTFSNMSFTLAPTLHSPQPGNRFSMSLIGNHQAFRLRPDPPCGQEFTGCSPIAVP
jgi:hypothetical protein